MKSKFRLLAKPHSSLLLNMIINSFHDLIANSCGFPSGLPALLGTENSLCMLWECVMTGQWRRLLSAKAQVLLLQHHHYRTWTKMDLQCQKQCSYSEIGWMTHYGVWASHINWSGVIPEWYCPRKKLLLTVLTGGKGYSFSQWQTQDLGKGKLQKSEGSHK